MSRTEYRIRYQVVATDREPYGREWRHIAHTRLQVIKFYRWIGSEAKRRAGKRGYRVTGIDERPVGRWAPIEGTPAEIIKKLTKESSVRGADSN